MMILLLFLQKQNLEKNLMFEYESTYTVGTQATQAQIAIYQERLRK